MTIQEAYPKGLRVQYSPAWKRGRRNHRSGTVVGYGGQGNPRCVRVRWDGVSQAETIHEDFLEMIPASGEPTRPEASQAVPEESRPE